jgi:hypothetical protein
MFQISCDAAMLLDFIQHLKVHFESEEIEGGTKWEEEGC